MDAIINNVKLCGISSCVPQNTEDNMLFSELLGTRRVKKQIKLTGVQKRHTSLKHQRASDLCMHAAKKLIQQLGWEKDSIGILIYITQSGDYVIPSSAIAMQNRLGLSKNCIAFDINLGCSAFNYGLHTVSAILNTASGTKRALCLIADSVDSFSSKQEFDEDTISFSMLSGSAGSAIALEKASNEKMIFSGICDGSNYDAIIKRTMDCDTSMKGNVVFDFAINEVSDEVNRFRLDNGIAEDEIDFYVFHQAQKLILDSIADACSIPEEKMLFSLSEYGNTSGASLPMTICANKEVLSKKKKVRLLLCGFGVGLSCGITYIEMDTSNIMSVEETDEHFDEDKAPDKKLKNTCVLVMDADKNELNFISRMLDDESANLILCGTDDKKLKSLQDNIFWSSNTICADTEEAMIDQIVSLDKKIQGVIYKGFISEKLVEKLPLEENASVVCLIDEKTTIQEDGCNEVFDYSDDDIRINYIKYDSDKLDFVLEDWADIFLKKGLPKDMLLTKYMGNSVIWLLGKESKFISGSVIRLKNRIV